MRREKGQYGYRDSVRRMRLMITIVLGLGVLAQLGARYLTENQAAKNILKVKEAEQSLNKLFTANRLDPNMKLFLEERSFLRRLDSLKPWKECENDGTVEYGTALLKSLSM